MHELLPLVSCQSIMGMVEEGLVESDVAIVVEQAILTGLWWWWWKWWSWRHAL